MSYLVLDRTKINYVYPEVSRSGVILSQVIDSTSGPPSPTLVSSVDELDVYFGRDFKERHYFEELLRGNVTLLLTTPMKPDTQSTPFLDTTGYKVISEVEAEGGVKVLLRFPDQLPEEGERESKYYVSSEDTYYIYYDRDWVALEGIAKEDPPITNYDTLRLMASGWSHFSWCWPKYTSRDYIPEYTETLTKRDDIDSLCQSMASNAPDDPGKSVGFTLTFPDSKITETPGEEWTYLVVPVGDGEKIQFYVGKDNSLPPDILDSIGRYEIPDASPQYQRKVVIDHLKEHGWKCLPADEEGLRWKLYNSDLLQDLEFCNIQGISFTRSPETTHNVLSVLSEPYRRMEVYSKVLGERPDKIQFEVTKIPGKKEWYRIVISRYDVQEIFEGPLYPEPDEETGAYTFLEKSINQLSEIVRVKVFQSRPEVRWTESGERVILQEVRYKYSKDNPGDGLPEGIYTLGRATTPDPWTPDDYWRGMEALKEIDISEDFLMIPRIEDLLRVGQESSKSWYTEYENLLDYAAGKNCQVLISNHPYTFGCRTWDDISDPRLSRPDHPEEDHMYFIGTPDLISAETWDGEGWKVWAISDGGGGRWKEILETFTPGYTGNQIFNLTDDPENRLVYFYQDLTYLGWTRPGWYVFLRGILSGGYTLEVSDIIYPSPAAFYTEDLTDLETYKSNFLSDNGHIYYYRRLFSHTGDWKYTTSIISRFCKDKVSNTVARDFKAYLSKTTVGEIIGGLENILLGLRSAYPVIGELEIDHIEEDVIKKSLSVYLNLGIRETLDKDVKLSVTLNFNFT